VTLTTIASLVPMAWGSATDSMFGAIALATAGGTAAGTIAALWLMPAMLVGTWKFRRRRRHKGGKGPKGPGIVSRVLGRFRRAQPAPEMA
jgi:multidrug efflux pump subunit AcrB